ncbi:MAG TPA: NUDIX domain-containing protein [Candidatus Dormibacteraeota bacterium]|nr:NUDIX domain-containing protein [Candidatus Dormibacteraeota bacterium]
MTERPAGVPRASGGARREAPTVAVGGVPYDVWGAQAAILREGRILLQFRLWPPGWELPGGHCNDGETPLQTALREAREETGLRVTPVGFVGVFRWAGLRRSADAVYLCEAVGGASRRTIEAVSLRWVERSSYPRAVFPWIPRRVDDAFDVAAGGPPVVREQPVTMRHVLFFGSSLAGSAVDEARRMGARLRRGR